MAALLTSLAANLPSLAITDEVTALAAVILRRLSLPTKAATDAVHIAVSVVHGVDYLLTWNCKHIANAEMRTRLLAVCEVHGRSLPVICTPAELMGE